jgi:tol-pal system-associated acyl-CoA thioesterase
MIFKTGPYRVYVVDTDVAGVVHHSNYLRYFEAGRIEFLRSLGLPYIDFQHEGIGFVPVNIDIHYHTPLREDDEYVVSVELIEIKKASFIVKQTVAGNHRLHASATIKLACVKEPEFKPRRLPEALITKLL